MSPPKIEGLPQLANSNEPVEQQFPIHSIHDDLGDLDFGQRYDILEERQKLSDPEIVEEIMAKARFIAKVKDYSNPRKAQEFLTFTLFLEYDAGTSGALEISIKLDSYKRIEAIDDGGVIENLQSILDPEYQPALTNDNCLEGVCCPKCGQEESFSLLTRGLNPEGTEWMSQTSLMQANLVSIEHMVRWSDEGSHDLTAGDTEFIFEGAAICQRCNWVGKVKDLYWQQVNSEDFKPISINEALKRKYETINIYSRHMGLLECVYCGIKDNKHHFQPVDDDCPFDIMLTTDECKGRLFVDTLKLLDKNA